MAADPQNTPPTSPERPRGSSSWASRNRENVQLARAIGRDLLLYGVASYLLIGEAAGNGDGRPLVIGAALTLFGFPLALGLDRWFARRDEQRERS